jgi:signal transduction histidine kinase
MPLKNFAWARLIRQRETNGLRRVSEQCLIGVLSVALVTLVCYRLDLSLPTVSLLYLIVVVLLSIRSGFFSLAFVSIVSVGCLNYFFAPPLFSFRVTNPFDVVAITVFLTISLIITRLISRLRKMADEARTSVHRKLIDAEAREYATVAAELDGDIIQRIALVAFDLEQLEQLERSPSKSVAEVSTHIHELWQRVSEIAIDLNAITHRWRSSTLEYLGIATSAESFCKQFAAQHKVELDFKSHDVPSTVPLEISFALIRVLQEALLNSARHSGERRFKVELFGSSSAIHLTVCDSGIGFDPDVAMQRSGLGLTSMRERLKLVNGEFSIESQAQLGTKIHASVPFSSGRNARTRLGEKSEY